MYSDLDPDRVFKDVPSKLYENKKTKQRIELLFANTRFVADIAILHNRFAPLLKEANARVLKYIKFTQTHPNKKVPYEKIFSGWRGIAFDQKMLRAVADLAKKYKLPFDQWRDGLIDLIFYGRFTDPVDDFMTGNNFGIIIETNKFTGEKELYLRIYGDTSRDDVVAGWSSIKKIQKQYGIVKRFYPIPNLSIEKLVREVDEHHAGEKMPDRKREKLIFPSDDPRGSKQRIIATRVLRHRDKKRFRTES
jgi:hypothetical protein